MATVDKEDKSCFLGLASTHLAESRWAILVEDVVVLREVKVVNCFCLAWNVASSPPQIKYLDQSDVFFFFFFFFFIIHKECTSWIMIVIQGRMSTILHLNNNYNNTRGANWELHINSAQNQQIQEKSSPGSVCH
jgi:hypothetical protein